ncbi:MAG: hypothetical protein MPI95_05595 [Nitrosopumilus sp.]|nr:hypothetical protein [Nitrosopumilus sp.]MDA7943053.1 hypothetical protein [Nitrosopumilus sp.]MDA7958543.1 hypothetical protein [Nitrosopumilus sp.]MDA7999280.1 hypothetical protein [Nitrosopumilus sp.]
MADAGLICWFCKRGRHSECQVEIPVEGGSDGPHECSFDTVHKRCACDHGL